MLSELIILAGCLVLSACFSAIETSFTALSSHKLSHMIENRVPGAKLVKKLKENPGKLLSTILIGNNIVNIGASVLAATALLNFLESIGWGSAGVAAGIATGIMTFMILVFGEIIPKTIAIKHAPTTVIIFCWPIYLLTILLTPVAAFLAIFSTPIVKLFGAEFSSKNPFVTEEEIKTLIAAGVKEGVIENLEKEMISSVFEFGDTTVKEVMTHRQNIKALSDDSTVRDVIQLIEVVGHSRIPIFHDNLDNIVGVIYAKDLLAGSPKSSIKEFMHPALFVPESKRLDDTMHQMQAARTHLAIVVDESGSTTGIVALEDLVEEIVGEIHDEFETHRGEKA